jgi:hypothetical protein
MKKLEPFLASIKKNIKKLKQVLIYMNKQAVFLVFIISLLVISGCSTTIQTQGKELQQQLIKEQESRKKITTAVEIISITAKGDKTDNTLNDFETLVRLDAGSDPLDFSHLTIEYNTTGCGTNVCTPVKALYQPTEICDLNSTSPGLYCIQDRIGNNDSILGDGEVFEIRYRAAEPLLPGQEFQFIFSSEDGRITQAKAKAPDVIQTTKVPLWPVG